MISMKNSIENVPPNKSSAANYILRALVIDVAITAVMAFNVKSCPICGMNMIDASEKEIETCVKHWLKKEIYIE